MDIVQQEEVLLALRNLWMVDDMEVGTEDCENEKDGLDQEMLDLTHSVLASEPEVQIQMDIDQRCDMNNIIHRDTVNGVSLDHVESCDFNFNEQIRNVKSPTLNKQISDSRVQNLANTEGFGKYFYNQLVVISLVGIKSNFYTRKRSWSGRGGWVSWSGTTPGARTLARGRRRITASLGTTVGKDKISRGYLNLQVAGEGHEAHVQEQQVADPVQHAGEEAEE